ncbi:Hemolysin III family protein [Rhodovastum atsumiense]|uniref:Hemolysin III family protein n=1 Tax=Rhodovastum atsumiense TaxID=504468 RepID=A0A5M6IZ73_9PROT|nr:hemolysin III family protein [Rhodovastum atsumiense]KAA5613650.1 hemolysin III family protein [Rhodovastum atsumiense]CAH2599557.1 Hemolysin III family protein [Rhodovastum atsumiense]
MPQAPHNFPSYSRAEITADRIVHLIGVPTAVIAAIWLIVAVSHTDSTRLIVTMSIYSAGLVGMLTASAAYHLSPPGRLKEILRRADHAMIFVMIAGSYTPFTLNALDSPDGVVLCAVVWSLAVFGVTMKLLFPRRFERMSLVLYLGMGWLVLSMIPSLIDRLPGPAFALLVGGGIAYSIGAVIYTRRRLRFHNAAWHVLVLIGAGLHLTALTTAFLPGA